MKTELIYREKATQIRRQNLSRMIAVFLALAPFFDPYILFHLGSGITLRINDVFLLIMGLLCFLEIREFEHKGYFLGLWCFLFFVTTLFAFLDLDKSMNFPMAMKNILIWTFYSVVIGFLWSYAQRADFFKCVQIVGCIVSVVALLQFICGHLELPMWNGRITFLKLSEYDGWAGYIDWNTGDVRPNGIFQESSYVGLYLSIAYAQAIKENKMPLVILFAVAMFLSTSMVAVVLCAFATVYLLLFQKKAKISRKIVYRFLFVLGLFVGVGAILIATNESVRDAFSYVINRFDSMESDLTGERMGSTKIRLIGNLPLFLRYPAWQQLFGVGAAQYGAYFNTLTYSNNFVITLMDYGIVGFVGFIMLLVKLYRQIEPDNKVFFFIVLLVFLSDRQWFNWYFFYLLTPCVIAKSSLISAKEKDWKHYV